jgi:uncharacterized protein (DUF1684 family)
VSTPTDPLSLADWRRRVAEMYAAARHNPNPRAGWQAFRGQRERLFAGHPASPLDEPQQASFKALPFYPYDPAWRKLGRLDKKVEHRTYAIELPSEGSFRYTRVANVRFDHQGEEHSLSLFWVEGYGGGLFLPFQDLTCGENTYGGGRYLYDGIKGADLNLEPDGLLLDFNFAYNPSCAYNDRWVCPLSPPENRLGCAVEAGEQRFLGD